MSKVSKAWEDHGPTIPVSMDWCSWNILRNFNHGFSGFSMASLRKLVNGCPSSDDGIVGPEARTDVGQVSKNWVRFIVIQWGMSRFQKVFKVPNFFLDTSRSFVSSARYSSHIHETFLLKNHGPSAVSSRTCPKAEVLVLSRWVGPTNHIWGVP